MLWNKNAICVKNGPQIHNLATLLPRHPSRSFFFHNNYCLFSSKHLDTMANVMDCGYGKTNVWKIFNFLSRYFSGEHKFSHTIFCLSFPISFRKIIIMCMSMWKLQHNFNSAMAFNGIFFSFNKIINVLTRR